MLQKDYSMAHRVVRNCPKKSQENQENQMGKKIIKSWKGQKRSQRPKSHKMSKSPYTQNSLKGNKHVSEKLQKPIN